MNALALIRSLIIYSLCLPLAIYLGYLLAMPATTGSLTIVSLALFLPLVPVLLRWHHWLLIFSWNLSAVVFLLPGRPYLWMLMALVSLTLSILQHILNRNVRFLYVPSVVRPLILLTLVILITAQLTGGFGMQAFGGEFYGGKRYFLLLLGVVGYFALTAYRVPPERANLVMALFLLSGLTAAIANVGPFLNPELYRIFLIFPLEDMPTGVGDAFAGPDTAMRLGGLTNASMAILSFLLARHGLRGLFALGEDWRFLPFRFQGGLSVNNPWRLFLFGAAFWFFLQGGYRSMAIVIGFIMLFQFFYEGLHRTQLFPIFVLAGILVVTISLPMINKLPLTIQRSLSFLPLEVDPVAKASAEASTAWRVKMWQTVAPMVPQYLILGKGYAIKSSDLQMSTLEMNASSGTEGAVLASDYHNGPLSVIIPLGIFGVIGFVWFLGAGFNVLLKNLRHGNPEVRLLNVFLISSFSAHVLCFITVFGSFYSDLVMFTGLVGLSVSLNGGVCAPAVAPVEVADFSPFKLARARR